VTRTPPSLVVNSIQLGWPENGHDHRTFLEQSTGLRGFCRYRTRVFGLSALRGNFDWQRLTTTAFGHLILLLLDSGNVGMS